jgi:hypothetical protein
MHETKTRHSRHFHNGTIVQMIVPPSCGCCRESLGKPALADLEQGLATAPVSSSQPPLVGQKMAAVTRIRDG